MLALLKEACQAFLDNRYSISQFQGSISTAASAITSYEDRELRKYLENVEANIDIIRFTNSEIDAAKQARLIAEEVLRKLEDLDQETWRRVF